MNRKLIAVVLAAGQGTRMKSQQAKVLHELMERPMVYYPLRACRDAGIPEVCVVVGHQSQQVQQQVQKHFPGGISFALQQEQKGTGHAVRMALEQIPEQDASVVIVYGDMPLLQADRLNEFVAKVSERGATMGLVTSLLQSPSGYGRIVRDQHGAIVRVVEERDCDEFQTQIKEVNSGIYIVQLSFLKQAIEQLRTDNAQAEFLLTDIVALAAKQNSVVTASWPETDVIGVNDRWQLSICEAELLRRRHQALSMQGVRFRDPARCYVGPDVEIAADALIESGVVIRGKSKIAAAHIDVGCVLDTVQVDQGAHLKPYTVATDTHFAKECEVGPFSHLRPGTQLQQKSKVGNFVEIKKSEIGARSKVNHLSYVGDAEIGAGVNIGAGTIFCNYDGFQKHKTVIEEGAFVGSDTQLVAPLRIGKNAYVATGTTVTKDVPADALAVGRVRQQNKEAYASKLRARLKVQPDKST